MSAPDPRQEPAGPPDEPAPSGEAPADGEADGPRRSYHTVETLVRARVAAMVGGPRGGVEVALPIAVFTLVYVLVDELGPAVAAGVGSALLLLAVRLVQRSSTRFVRNGLLGMGIAAVVALGTGRAEDAFLPGILQSAGWSVVLAASILVRRPLAGYLIGAVLGDPSGWRHHGAVVRLANKLTLVLLVPMLVRVAAQLPLFLAGEVGWLGVSRIVLGWPLSLAALAAAAAILARGDTPLYAEHPSD